MRMLTFAKRCGKEILRDPLNLGFGLGFPLVLLLLLTTIQKNIPVDLFEIDTLAPGITVFGLSFMTLFSATLVAKDRESALLQRLYTTPLTAIASSGRCWQRIPWVVPNPSVPRSNLRWLVKRKPQPWLSCWPKASCPCVLPTTIPS